MALIYFEDLNVGDSWAAPELTVDADEMLAYARANDPWPIHIDPEAAAKTPFGGLIASGGYTITLMYRLFHEIANRPDRRWVFLGGFDWHLKFPEPVRSGDRLHARITILDKPASTKPGRGIIKSRTEVINDRGAVALSLEVASMLATRPQ
jgi:acyl dehydratase